MSKTKLRRLCSILVLSLCYISSVFAVDTDPVDGDEDISVQQQRYVPEFGLVEAVIIYEGMEALCNYVVRAGAYAYAKGSSICRRAVSVIQDFSPLEGDVIQQD